MFFPSFIQTVTVGLGVSPNHVPFNETRGLYHRSGIAPNPEGNTANCNQYYTLKQENFKSRS